jgi:hypothetical protein
MAENVRNDAKTSILWDFYCFGSSVVIDDGNRRVWVIGYGEEAEE